MDPFSAEADDATPRRPPPPKSALPAPGRAIPTMRALGEFVHDLRVDLGIRQADLAARADVSRSWIVSLEQGRPSVEAGKALRTLEALGFEVSVVPYDPPPPWMLRAVAAARTKKAAALERRNRRRNTKRERLRLSKLVDNVRGEALDLG